MSNPVPLSKPRVAASPRRTRATQLKPPCEICGKPKRRDVLGYCSTRCLWEAVRRDFPIEGCTCGVCGIDGCLIYPNIEMDDPTRSGQYRPTLICPTCSTPEFEEALRAEATAFGYPLKPIRIFEKVLIA